MKQGLIAALLLGAAALPASAGAQPAAAITQSIAGTRLDLSASGDVTRVPDLAIITAGVVARSATASGALQQAATRMQRVRAALKAAGIEDRDIQTSNINLNPEYTYANNEPPKLNGYSASNQVTVRFRDIANAGKILDALVAEGANQIDGPNLTIEHPEAALDEARTRRRSPTGGRGPSSTRARSASAWCGSSRSAKAAEAIRCRRRCRWRCGRARTPPPPRSTPASRSFRSHWQ